MTRIFRPYALCWELFGFRSSVTKVTKVSLMVRKASPLVSFNVILSADYNYN